MMNKFFNFLKIARKSGNILLGYNRCNELKNKTNIYLFIISKDASPSSKRKFKNYCIANNIKYIEDFSKEELGIAVSMIEVKIIAISDCNIANKLLDLYQEGKKAMK